MVGREVFKHAVTRMREVAERVIERAGLTPTTSSSSFPTRPTCASSTPSPTASSVPNDRVFVNLHKYGNTSAAAVAIALDEAHREGRFQRGDHIVMVAFGAGLTWAAAAISGGSPVSSHADVEGRQDPRTTGSRRNRHPQPIRPPQSIHYPSDVLPHHPLRHHPDAARHPVDHRQRGRRAILVLRHARHPHGVHGAVPAPDGRPRRHRRWRTPPSRPTSTTSSLRSTSPRSSARCSAISSSASTGPSSCSRSSTAPATPRSPAWATFGHSGWWLFAGLALICLGSGGIKPCVSAHVGDQFGPSNQHLLTTDLQLVLLFHQPRLLRLLAAHPMAAAMVRPALGLRHSRRADGDRHLAVLDGPQQVRPRPARRDEVLP